MPKEQRTPSRPISDEEIVKLFLQRDERAIRETDNKYGRMLLSIAGCILSDPSDCEECQNDTYLALWNSIPPNRPDSFTAYLSRIARNIALNRYKEKARKRRVPSEFTVSLEELENTLKGENTTESELSAKELAALINRFLKNLNDRRRYIFIGRFYMGNTLKTIASELNVNVSTVQRETESIKQSLKAFLERNGVYV